MRCDICGEVTTLPANEQRPEGWGTFIYRSPTQGDIEKDVCPTCAGALERNETVNDRRIKMPMDEVTPLPVVYPTNEGTNEE